MPLSDLIRSEESDIAIESRCETAYAYIRESHENSAEKNLSAVTQRQAIEAYSQLKGYTITNWYQDRARSAFKNDDKRDQFQQMLRDAQADPDVAVIICYRYDRFSRNALASSQQVALASCGVRIESVEEGYQDPNSETGSLMMPLFWGMSRSQSVKLRNVVVPNMKTNMRQRDPVSKWAYKNGGPAMWGYKIQHVAAGTRRNYTRVEHAIWVLDDTIVAGKPVCEWARIALIDWRLKEELGFRQVGDRLTKCGVPTPTGGDGWYSTTVHDLLSQFDKIYQFAGYGIWNRRNYQNERLQMRDRSEWIIEPNAHAAIITEEQADALWALQMRRKERRAPSNPASRYALSGGLLVCKKCGQNFAGKTSSNCYYLCGSHVYKRGYGCTKGWYIPKDELEGMILSKLMEKATGSLDLYVKAINEAIEGQWAEFKKSAREREAKLSKLKTELQNLIDVAAAGGNTDDLVERIRRTDGVVKRLEKLSKAQKPAPVTIDEVRSRSGHLLEAVNSADADLRKLVLQRYVVELKADPVTRTIEGTLVNPLTVPDSTEGPESFDSGPSVCRQMVGQGTGCKTANSPWELARCYRKSRNQLIVAAGDALAPVLKMRPQSELTRLRVTVLSTPDVLFWLTTKRFDGPKGRWGKPSAVFGRRLLGSKSSQSRQLLAQDRYAVHFVKTVCRKALNISHIHPNTQLQPAIFPLFGLQLAE